MLGEETNNIGGETNSAAMPNDGAGASTSGASVTPTAATPAAGAPTAAPAAAPAPAPAGAVTPQKPTVEHGNLGGKILHGILGALGGTEETAYRRATAADVQAGAAKQEGEMIVSSQKIGPGQQWKRIIAGALMGAASGASVKPGPGHLGRSAGAGFQAGANMAQQDDEAKYKRANDDYEAEQQTTTRKAQVALLNQQTSELSFKNSRAKVQGAFEDAARENSFAAMIQSGGANSTDLGIAKDVNAVMELHKNMPSLLKEQAQGNILGVPHVNDQGQVDGMHYALVTPEWKSAKLESDQPFYRLVPPSKEGGKPTVKTELVKAGTMTNGDYMTSRMAAEKEIMGWYDKQATLASEEKRTDTTAGASVEGAKIHAGATVEAARIGAERAERVAGVKANRDDVRTHDKTYVVPAEATEKSYQMLSHAYDEYKAAKAQGKELPTGAQSMLALSTHLATTFGNVKGARVTRDMIQHHLGARSIPDSAMVAIQKLTNGDALSGDQWEAFHDLVAHSRRLSWESAVKEGVRKQVPIDFVPDDLHAMAEEVSAPKGATGAVWSDDGRTLLGHVLAGKFVVLGGK